MCIRDSLYDVVDTFAGQDFRSGLRVFYHFIPAEDTDENHVVGAEVPLHALTLTHDVGTNFNFLDIANDTDGPGGTPILHPDADEDAYRFAVENWVYFSQAFGSLITLEADESTVIGSSSQLLAGADRSFSCLLYTSPSPRDRTRSRMPSSA